MKKKARSLILTKVAISGADVIERAPAISSAKSSRLRFAFLITDPLSLSLLSFFAESFTKSAPEARGDPLFVRVPLSYLPGPFFLPLLFLPRHPNPPDPLYQFIFLSSEQWTA